MWWKEDPVELLILQLVSFSLFSSAFQSLPPSISSDLFQELSEVTSENFTKVGFLTRFEIPCSSLVLDQLKLQKNCLARFVLKVCNNYIKALFEVGKSKRVSN